VERDVLPKLERSGQRIVGQRPVGYEPWFDPAVLVDPKRTLKDSQLLRPPAGVKRVECLWKEGYAETERAVSVVGSAG